MIDHRQDDDVDTDEEVMNNAVCAAINDAEVTKAQGGITNNSDILSRCLSPEDYDRSGKYI